MDVERVKPFLLTLCISMNDERPAVLACCILDATAEAVVWMNQWTCVIDHGIDLWPACKEDELNVFAFLISL